MTNAQAAALTRIARLCARRGDYSALRAYVEALQASPSAPARQPDGTYAWSQSNGNPYPYGGIQPDDEGFRLFGWRLW